MSENKTKNHQELNAPQDRDDKQQELDTQKEQDEQIRETGQLTLDQNKRKHRIELLTIIGEVEGHDAAPSQSKTTKYEHVLPKLAMIEDDEEIEGLLILLNTVGGDVEAGLAIAEMIASLSVPTVSLVLGGGHSIGVPMAVSADYSFVVPSATMVIHPVRSSGMFIGVAQTGPYHQFYCFTFQSVTATSRRIDAGYQSACKRCRNASGRGGSCKGGPDR